MTLFFLCIFFFSCISAAAANTAPDDIPPAIPSYFPKALENWNAELLLIGNISSITFKLRFSGIKPAPIPCIECEPGSPPLITAESSGSTAIIFIFKLKWEFFFC